MSGSRAGCVGVAVHPWALIVIRAWASWVLELGARISRLRAKAALAIAAGADAAAYRQAIRRMIDALTPPDRT